MSQSASRALTQWRVLRSEWIKIVTLRSTWITIAAIVAVIIGFGLLSALVASGSVTPSSASGGGPPTEAMRRNPVNTVTSGANLAVLIVAVLGSIIGAREFASGMIRTTLWSVPRRLPVLWGKVIVFIGLVLPVVLVSVVAVFFLGTAILEGSGSPSAAWTDDGVARSIIGLGFYIVGLGIVGLALGILLRGTAASIGVVIGAVIFIPALATALLPDSWDEVLKYLPSNAGAAFTTPTTPGAIILEPGIGALVFAAWILVAMAAAAWALVRRDA
jgi:ABC-type transport system involved in multi-copper enzyme maturation permease subunit